MYLNNKAMDTKKIKEIAKKAWFEGMQQGIITDRQDKIKKHTTTKVLGNKITFEEWWDSEKIEMSEQIDHDTANGFITD